MNFSLTTEQSLLRDSARQFVELEHPFDVYRSLVAKGVRRGGSLWKSFAELGWLSISAPESLGGLGGGDLENCLIVEEMGRGLMSEPFLAIGVYAARVIALSANSLAMNRLLPLIGKGEAFPVVAETERQSEDGIGRIETRARVYGGGFILSGSKSIVLNAEYADVFIVSALLNDQVALFLVPTEAPGVSLRNYALVDDSRASDIELVSVAVGGDALLVGPEHGQAVMEEAMDQAAVTLCAYMLGCMEKSMEMTLDYIKQRRQFGRALGDFQVMQHRMADMFIETDNARSMLYRGLSALNISKTERQLAVSACKVAVSEAAKTVIGAAIHNHGGMGMSLDYPVGHYFRRIIVAEKSFGSSAYHIERYCRLQESINKGPSQHVPAEPAFAKTVQETL